MTMHLRSTLHSPVDPTIDSVVRDEAGCKDSMLKANSRHSQ